MQERERQAVSQHILGTSANLLGICFAIFSVIRVLGRGDLTYIDEIAVVSVFLFLFSCLFSYVSMRSRKRWLLYERIADFIFITALGFLSLLALVIATGIMQ
jgi:hypothetical protein